MTDLEDSKIVELYLSRDQDAIAQTAQKYGNRLHGDPSHPIAPKATSTHFLPELSGTNP